jgi:hypothetical protein
MKITRAHILGWTALAVAAAVLIIDTGKPEAAPPPVAAAPADDGWRVAAGNLAPGMGLYFGRHDKIYRGLIMKFVDTPHGEAAVLSKDGQLEVMLRKDIAIRDFWVRAP